MASSSYWNQSSSSDESDSESPHLSPRAVYGRHTHARSITTIRLPVQISDDDEDEPHLVTHHQSISQSNSQSNNQSSQLSKHQMNHRANGHPDHLDQSNHQSNHGPPTHSNDPPINQSAHPSIHQSSHPPTNHAINQTISQPQPVLAKPSLLTTAKFAAPPVILTATPPPLPARKSSFNAREHGSPLPLPKPLISQSVNQSISQSRPSTPSDTFAESASSFFQTTPMRGVSFASSEKSFSSHLSAHFQTINNQSVAGSYTAKRIASLFKKVAELEEQFATGLRKALAVEQGKLHRAQMINKDHMSLCCSAWSSSQDQVAHLASIHAANAQRTMDDCVIPILNQFASQEERRKELVADERRCSAELMKCQDDVVKQFAICQNHIKQAKTLAMDGDNINNPSESASINENNRPLILKSLTKHFRSSAKTVNQSTLKAAKSYSELIHAANQRQFRYMQQELPGIFNGMQDMEHARLLLIKDKLRLYSDAQIQSINQSLAIMNKVKQESSRMDPDRDIQSFIDICLSSSPAQTQSNFPFTNTTLGSLSGSSSGSSTPSFNQSINQSVNPFVYALPYTLREIEDGRFMNSSPNMPSSASSNLFGNTVESAMQAQSINHRDLLIPLVVHKCITIISERGLNLEGIFRISIPSNELTQLRNDAQVGDFTALDAAQPHAAAGLLKFWLRSLSEPIISEALYQQAMTLAQQPTFDGRDAQSIFYSLPITNQRIIDALAKLAIEIESNESTNLMNFTSLSIVFAPGLMRNPSQDPAKLLDSSRWETKFVVTLLRARAQSISQSINQSINAEQPISVDAIDFDSSDSASVSISERKR